VNRTATALLTVAIAAAGLTACSSDKDTSTPAAKTPPPAAAPSAPASSNKPLASAEAKNGIPPKPDAATQAKYIAALNAIDPAVVNGKEDRAVSRGRDTCGTAHSFPKDHAKVVDTTRQRFSGAKQFNTAQAEKILTAVQKHLCPKT
jgi:hypothetical protein